MRYRVGEVAEAANAVGGTESVLLLTGIIGLVVGVVLTWAGWRGRQMWLVVWCGGLIIASIVYIGWIAFGARA